MSFKDILGHNQALTILQNEIVSNTIKNSYIFYGIKGIGKKFAAIQFAKILFCENPKNTDCCDDCEYCKKIDDGVFPDVLIVDFNFQAKLLEEKIETQKNIKIETIREVHRLATLSPYYGKKKVFIIDNAETMQRHAANSLLKILEEPPQNCIFILISSSLGVLLKTIISRCELIKFSPLTEENLKKIVPQKQQIVENSFGSLENIQYLEKILNEFNFEKLRNLTIQEIQNISENISDKKDLVKFFLFYLIENRIKHIEKTDVEKLILELEHYLEYYSRLNYNLDFKLFVETILTEMRENLWNKN